MSREPRTDTAYFSSSAAYLEALAEGPVKSAVVPAPQSPAERFPRQEALEVSDLPLLHCEATQVGVLQLINAYRFHGFRQANLDPIKALMRPHISELEPVNHGLLPADLDQTFETGSLVGPQRDTLRNIQARLQAIYCGTLGAEYMFIRDTSKKRWLQQRIEGGVEAPEMNPGRRRWLLSELTAAESLEKFLHTRFVGQKRFSLEGGESLIPLLNYLIELATDAGMAEVGLGMAHRGRINVLHNVLDKSAIAMFEQAGREAREVDRAGDVKYHQGMAMELYSPGGSIRVALAFNPSHLEIVNPVVEGWARAQQQRRGDRHGNLVMPVLIHGDAALSGQGVVMETLNMAATRGFTTGGTIHVVVNNQIGFTTSDTRDARSTLHCTDVFKMVDAPVLHVNADDPEAVLWAVKIAFDYRMTFRCDVVIDLVCYRRLGHNEQDEPMVTQPLMYRRIRELPTTRELYAQRLLDDGVVKDDEAERMYRMFYDSLDAPVDNLPKPRNPYGADWAPYKGQHWRAPADTSVPLDRLRLLGQRLCEVPEGFTLHPRVIMILGNRRQMLEGTMRLDWGMAETLAYATLLTEGHGVRLSGQDSGRGTFFHRHAVWHDQQRETRDTGYFIPLQHLQPGQAHFLVIDSLLSEAAVLGFEYGYAGAEPEQLVIWEAQFGDFANGAQVLIDQFIAAGEVKWGRLNGLTLFLPHGYEGQGPEHSSARIERFLQLAADDNMQLVQPSTPGQFFHVLRRQVLRPYRHPLVLFTPKSLLRHPDSSSDLEELSAGGFQPVLDDAGYADVDKVARVVFCSGRIYFDLAREREARGRADIALLRLEQLHPLPEDELLALLARYGQAREIFWAQDEPRNQGAWHFTAYHLARLAGQKIHYAGRPASASPATGHHATHKRQLENILATVFAPSP